MHSKANGVAGPVGAQGIGGAFRGMIWVGLRPTAEQFVQYTGQRTQMLWSLTGLLFGQAASGQFPPKTGMHPHPEGQPIGSRTILQPAMGVKVVGVRTKDGWVPIGIL